MRLGFSVVAGLVPATSRSSYIQGRTRQNKAIPAVGGRHKTGHYTNTDEPLDNIVYDCGREGGAMGSSFGMLNSQPQ
jgi:hypothetical protein